MFLCNVSSKITFKANIATIFKYSYDLRDKSLHKTSLHNCSVSFFPFAHVWHRHFWPDIGVFMFRAAEHPSQQLSRLLFIFNCSPQWRPIKDEDSRVRITHKTFEGHRLSICFAGRLPLTHFICARIQTLGYTQ